MPVAGNTEKQSDKYLWLIVRAPCMAPSRAWYKGGTSPVKETWGSSMAKCGISDGKIRGSLIVLEI
jgi:hypothetical protein